MTEYEIGKSGGRGADCGQALSAPVEFFSAGFERAAGFVRGEYCERWWTRQGGPPGEAMCHFRARAAVREERARVFIDDAALVEFFERLGTHPEDELKRDFRFVLALILMRKRILK